VHNKHCHAKRFLAGNLLLRSIIARVATKLHVHCGEAVGIMAPLLKVPEQKFTVIPHPRYPVTHIDAREARSFCTRHLVPNLAAGKPVFLMYGNIGAYKGCIECVPLIPPSAQLIIAGAVKKHEDRYLSTLRELIRTRDNIHLIPRFVTAEEEANLFNAADCVLFNFTDTLTSGSVILALSYGKRILAPAVGCCRELAAEHAMIFQTQDELRDCIRKFIHHPAEQ
jgi:glycosyltransferase involved in cell wall biosynthesis